jgi:hypothetical protein
MGAPSSGRFAEVGGGARAPRPKPPNTWVTQSAPQALITVQDLGQTSHQVDSRPRIVLSVSGTPAEGLHGENYVGELSLRGLIGLVLRFGVP